MRRLVLCVLVLAFAFNFPTVARAADEVSGYVVKLAEKTEMEAPQSINVGGLVVAVVRDSGSRPPQDIAVVASEQLAPLGTVRGVQNDDGVALMGGGYTWHLFRPAKAGDATVKVAYTENGPGGKRVERTYELSVK